LVDDDLPPYAILSHTWENDDEEVTFKDLAIGTGENKAGYGKIRFCGEQAARDGLEHFWIGTCCINKSNRDELSTAINSMFSWYRNAARCYVYLSDVLEPVADTGDQLYQQLLELTFRRSRWFTRGWTLPELIAPLLVEFFSKGGGKLGSKISLEQQIHEITRIPVEALQGSPLSNFSVTERMSWAKSRKATLSEDTIYSLLGIFGIRMAPNYGEGRGNAFHRLLKEIEKGIKGMARTNTITRTSL
jgi:hypothetical protein